MGIEAVQAPEGNLGGLPARDSPSLATGVRIRSHVATPSDADLLARCREGEPEAWDELVGRYERLIYSVALRNGLGHEEAADITQSTFLELLDSLQRIRDEDRLASWLMTVARRQAWRQRSRLRRLTTLDDVPEQTHDPFADWAEVATLHDALSTLGGTCRELLLSLYFDPDQPSYSAIAQSLGRSIGGIGPLRGRCLARLRGILAVDDE